MVRSKGWAENVLKAANIQRKSFRNAGELLLETTFKNHKKVGFFGSKIWRNKGSSLVYD